MCTHANVHLVLNIYSVSSFQNTRSTPANSDTGKQFKTNLPSFFFKFPMYRQEVFLHGKVLKILMNVFVYISENVGILRQILYRK